MGLAADRSRGRRMLGTGVEDSLNSSAQEKSIRKVLDLHPGALRFVIVFWSVSCEIADEIDECHGAMVHEVQESTRFTVHSTERHVNSLLSKLGTEND